MWLPLAGSLTQPAVGQKGFGKIVRNDFWMKDRNSYLHVRSVSVCCEQPGLGADLARLPEPSS